MGRCGGRAIYESSTWMLRGFKKFRETGVGESKCIVTASSYVDFLAFVLYIFGFSFLQFTSKNLICFVIDLNDQKLSYNSCCFYWLYVFYLR